MFVRGQNIAGALLLWRFGAGTTGKRRGHKCNLVKLMRNIIITVLHRKNI